MLHRTVDRFLESQRWLEGLGNALQKGIAVVYRGSAGRALKTMLNGTILGHPLHPILTDIPIGAWTLAVIFDVIYILQHGAGSRAAAELTVAVGILGALGAAVTGYTDWSDTVDRERRFGLMHGLLNSAALLLYILSFALRLGGGGQAKAILISWVGYLVLISAAYLGGELVFNIGTGVNHHAWEAPVTDWTPAIAGGRLLEGKLTRAVVNGTPVVLLKQGNRICAIGATCSHAGGPLDEGSLDGDIVVCPWHASRFDICSGAVKGGPATVSQVRYEARLQGDQVEVRRSADTLQPN